MLYIKCYMWGVHSGIGAWIGLGDFGDWGNMGKFEDAWKLKLVTIASIVSYMHNLLIIRFLQNTIFLLALPSTMLNRLQQVRYKNRRVLCRREMTQLRHSLESRPGNLVSRVLRHLRSIAPVVFTSEEVDWAFTRVDGFNSTAAVPAVEVEV